MRLKTVRLLALALLLGCMPGRGHTQKAGLWEERAVVDGTPTGMLVRECRVSGAQLSALQAWPASCVAKPLHRTASGMIVEARCASGAAGPSLVVRHELTGDLDRGYQVTTSSRVDGAASPQPTYRSTVTARYLGPCAGGGNAVSGPNTAGQPMPAREPLPIVLARFVIPPVLVIGSIAAIGVFFRRRRRGKFDQATVANIVTGTTRAATIPVLVTFTGVRGLPWWYGIAMNNAAPLLVIERDGIRFRVIRRQYRAFAEIACVDVRQNWRTVNLDFTFHGSIFTFAANVGTVALAAHVIASLPPGVPLSPRAQTLKVPA